MKTKSNSGFYEFEMLLLIIGICVAFLIAFFLGVSYFHSQGNRPEIYEAWRKANPSIEISYEEWQLLKDQEILPGQAKTPVSVPVVIHSR